MKWILLILIVIGLQSCSKDFFDQVPDDRLTVDDIFSRRAESEQYLANVYSYIMDESDQSMPNRVPWFNMSDEGDVNRFGAEYNIGNYNANTTTSYIYWAYYYNGIRSATYFMQRIGENAEIQASEGGSALIVRYRAEARALRAWFYAGLLKQYGPFVIIPGNGILTVETSPEDLKIPRSSYDQCVDFIVSELDEASKDLPDWYSTNNPLDYGRMNKTVCMALKARVLLYAASPLWNGNKDYANFVNKDGSAMVNQQYQPEKWKRAADAAKAVIDLNLFSLYKELKTDGSIDPFNSFQNLFFVAWNSEVIFARNKNELTASNTARNWDRRSSPRFAGGYSANGPTQKLVDAFQMANGERPILGYNANGSPIVNAASGYVEEGFSTTATPYTETGTWNMYVNREPRFYVSIQYSGSYWVNKTAYPQKVQLYFTGNTGKNGAGSDFSTTGYLPRKNIHPNTHFLQSRFVNRPLILFRLAEIYLSYAEALNEYNPGHPDIAQYVNLIRERAGIPSLPAGLTPDQMRERIWLERNVELAFERHRYFDTRRWKIAEQTDGGPFYGLNVDAGTSATDVAFYKRTVFETRVFEKQHYLFPIPQIEINKNLDNMVQNPGW